MINWWILNLVESQVNELSTSINNFPDTFHKKIFKSRCLWLRNLNHSPSFFSLALTDKKAFFLCFCLSIWWNKKKSDGTKYSSRNLIHWCQLINESSGSTISRADDFLNDDQTLMIDPHWTMIASNFSFKSLIKRCLSKNETFQTNILNTYIKQNRTNFSVSEY
jgi:hypothetical protein